MRSLSQAEPRGPPDGERVERWTLPRFRPALLDALPEMTGQSIARDVVAGAIVGVVAIPLAIAFAIASGVPPAAGIVTAVVAGFLVSLLGGGRVNIGGPTGAFVVIVLGIVQRFSVGELVIATLMAGLMLMLMGLFRLGDLIKFIPSPVVTGFTAGIGVVIFLTQVPDILGLRLDHPPTDTIDRLAQMASHAPQISGTTLALAAATVATILLFKRFAPRVPGPVVALLLLTFVAASLALPVTTIGSKFGGLPPGLPAPTFPAVNLVTLQRLLPSALTIAILGAIESLLCAVVSDGMTNKRHDSNQELMGQGIANIASGLFGGMPATGAIARTATNVQSGASSPVAGMVHAGVLLVFMYVLAPQAAAIPLVVLAGILTVVSYHMSDLPKVATVLRTAPHSDRLVLLATFLLTVFIDLTVAVEVGMILAAFLFMRRMSLATDVRLLHPGEDARYQQQILLPGDLPDGVLAYSIDGPFFFGAAENFTRTLDRVTSKPRVIIFRMRHVPYMDSTGLAALQRTVAKLQGQGVHVVLNAVQPQPLAFMVRARFLEMVGQENVQPNIQASIARAKHLLTDATPAAATRGPRASHP